MTGLVVHVITSMIIVYGNHRLCAQGLMGAGSVIYELKSLFSNNSNSGLAWFDFSNCELGILQNPLERFNKLETLILDIYDCLFRVMARY